MKTNNTAAAATNAAAAQALGHSPDALAQRKAELLAMLRQTAPELISDNQLNLDKLKDLLEPDRIADPLEHYELSWAGKTAARREIQKTSSHTLRPDPSNPAQAQHMLIEGENLEVLRVLQKSYYGKVKMIYIDPPYNTGNDSFVYPDNYSETLDEYQRRTGEKNEAGFLNKQNLWKKNSKESGQYHSTWLSMMYPRLYLARNLLRDDGIIFISIDDNEAANLKVLCDEIFGNDNFVEQIAWKNKYGSGALTKGFANVHEYIFAYTKSPLINIASPLNDEQRLAYKLKDEKYELRGGYITQPLSTNSKDDRHNLQYPIIHNGITINPEKQWIWSRERFLEAYKNNEIVINETNGKYSVRSKQYLRDERGVERLGKPISIMDGPFNQEGTKEIKSLFNGKQVFGFPKPTALIKYLMSFVLNDKDEFDFIALDFFAGSGSCAQAVMKLNTKDGGNRRSISVQMPEVIDEDSEAYKAGYRTIADITRARIDKVIAKLKAEHPDKTADLACAHFTLAPSNFKVWRGNASSAGALREQLALFRSAEKTDPSTGAERTDKEQAQAAMLAELLLKHGLGALGVHAISKPMQVAGATVHRVRMPNDKTMWLCFDPYTEALKGEIVKAAPAQVVLLNSCFGGSKADELLSNLQLELAGLEIGLTVI